MRKIELLDKLSIRFPQRSAEFDEGFEVGVLATLMAVGERRIERTVSASVLEQIRDLCERLRYRVAEEGDGGLIKITLEPIGMRPVLRLVR